MYSKVYNYTQQSWHLAGYVLWRKYAGTVGCSYFTFQFNRSINTKWQLFSCASTAAFIERYVPSTCTDVSEQRVAPIFRAEVGKKRQWLVHTGRQSQGPTGGAEHVSARSAITRSDQQGMCGGSRFLKKCLRHKSLSPYAITRTQGEHQDGIAAIA